jgi:hypothetical protein
MADRVSSWLVVGQRRRGLKSLGRISAPPKPRSALHSHVRGRDLLRVVDRNALPGLTCGLV